MADFGLTNKTFHTAEADWTHDNDIVEDYYPGITLPKRALEVDGGDLECLFTGVITTKANPPGTITITLYFYDVVAGTYTSIVTTGAVTPTGSLSSKAFKIVANLTIRATGTGGSVIADLEMRASVDATLGINVAGAATAVDLTKSWAIRLGVDWGTADVANIFTLKQVKYRGHITQ